MERSAQPIFYFPGGPLVDLRSDTVTKPCEQMLEAIKKASFGDDYYREDEVTNELEKYSAKYFGTEAALFMITGTMANQVALRCHTSPGDEVISDKYNHIVYYCASAAADLGKVSFNNVEAEQGILSVENVEEASSSRHRSPLNVHPRLVWLENTLNHYGGKIYPLEEFRKVAVYAKERGLKVHLDGARLLNACTATGISPVQYVQNVDSTTFSFSKALGAPAGSILLGDKQLVSSARVYQKWYGGGLHQSGLVAAACLYGLQNNVSRIVTDHRNARLLASSALEGLCGKLLKYPVETNIVMFDVSRLSISSDDFIDLAKKQNLLLYKWNDFVVRAVTHKGITENDVIYASQILRDIFLSLI